MLARAPFLIVAIVLAVATICVAALRWSESLPINPWEPAIAMEAVRLNRGLPLYESDHATHIYGPLLTVAIAGVFRVAGLSLLVARIAMSICAIALAALLATALCREALKKYWWLALLLLLGISFRTNLVFFSAQPDCVAALCALAGIFLWIRSSSLAARLGAVAFFIFGALFKQTAAAFAFIPIVHALLWTRPLKPHSVVVSLIPTMSIIALLALMRAVAPAMFDAVVSVPASIKVYPERVVGTSIYLIGTFPVLFVGLIALLARRRRLNETDRWILAALVVLVPASIWTICKSGGSYNSLLPAYLAMTALFVASLGQISERLASLSIWQSAAASTAIALSVLLSFFIQFDRAAALLFVRHGDEKCEAAVKVARQFQAISPQDPTIAYRANGYIGRSLFFELDKHAVQGNWPAMLPAPVVQELTNARNVITVRGYVPTPVFEQGLSTLGFHPVNVPELADSAYALWRRD